MAFFDLVAGLDATCLSTFSDYTITIHFKSGAADATVPCISRNPKMEEDYIPGSTQGVASLFLFIRFAGLTTLPQKGDTATVQAVEYDIFQVDADREGGATLRMRRRS